MFDAAARRLIDPPLARAGAAMAARGIGANAVTLAGLGIGLLSAVLIAGGAPLLALIPLLISRIADGLDGAIARQTRKTDFGGYLDIASDFAFYGAVPFAFVLLDPVHNAVAGAFLLFSFYVNAASFLGFAILAEKRGMSTSAQGEKSLYFSNGLLEGSETIAFFGAFCLFPGLFAPLAFVFGALCVITAVLRILAAHRIFTEETS